MPNKTLNLIGIRSINKKPIACNLLANNLNLINVSTLFAYSYFPTRFNYTTAVVDFMNDRNFTRSGFKKDIRGNYCIIIILTKQRDESLDKVLEAQLHSIVGYQKSQ